MSFRKLTFPLTVDFSGNQYWIGKQGPFKYGTAVTALFTGEDIAEGEDGDCSLMQELEVYLSTFGNYLHPYSKPSKITDELFRQLEQSSAECLVNYAFHPIQGSIVLVERCVFLSLRDFLYVELGRAILNGNGPRQCRLCGKWFLHEHGDQAKYCERIAPGETERTCREAGARAIFEKKLQDDEAWKLYKRAYKKYYARYMKGNMTESEFKAWGAQAATDRDEAIAQTKAVMDAAVRAQILDRLRERLNQM